MRRGQDRPAPRRRRACYDDFWCFVTGLSNPQRLRSARAVLEAWSDRAFHARFSAPIAPGPVLHSLPGTSPAAPDCGRSGRAPEKAYDAENSQAARPKGRCCRVNPSPLRILPVIGRVMRRRGGAVGRQGPDLMPLSSQFHKTFDSTGKIERDLQIVIAMPIPFINLWKNQDKFY